ncbi:hypothetical protein B5F07_15540 [Lachnoclostridium sp. An169]|uniref:DUF2975 domain-containing protein n=1 Tax=Lachnoclostridium sp. An169 TaxID=1965569 RepID=UPI000B36A479|nr:DUF2975 domain-containing protein [Lachnoclostridium sp. An169]OUP82005.1 hypothetical protein B5F07_15540 [Lachnoclostridium sp. An169]HJA65662.1 DUF2975 domain-containing protein [Candidatus Mediterraneibacter cottocaccae]
MKQSRLIPFTKYFLDFMFFTGLLVVITLPLTLNLAGKYFSQSIRENYWGMLIILGLSGICGLLIVYELRKVMKTVVKKDCFVDNNIKSLKIMGRVSFCICVLFLIKIFFLPTPATFIIVLTFFIAGLFSHVLSLVFAEAVRFKEENDLTI